MAGIDHWECACESQEVQMGTPEGTSECPSIVHSHTESPGDRSGYSATWPTFSPKSGICRAEEEALTRGCWFQKDAPR